MHFEQVRHKASGVSLNRGRYAEDHSLTSPKWSRTAGFPDKRTECEMSRFDTCVFLTPAFSAWNSPNFVKGEVCE